ncbi:Hypothetical_protein [Hexamita inflata]|uniref:Hypothetical_protein n=1 Tax=Hexamita inflata TaxID=28002 RepID=A0AA86UTA9_9EUKA|nr:Hypothetical protein HINF_LOCUS36738 [Hexamita inflata]
MKYLISITIIFKQLLYIFTHVSKSSVDGLIPLSCLTPISSRPSCVRGALLLVAGRQNQCSLANFKVVYNLIKASNFCHKLLLSMILILHLIKYFLPKNTALGLNIL